MYGRFSNLTQGATRLARGVFNRLKMLSLDQNVRTNKGQFIYGYLPDLDFELFALLDRAGGLVIDAGANRGHCAITILSQSKQLSVCSFEPNFAMHKALEYIHKKYPSRFAYHLCGLGQHKQTRKLHIPVCGSEDLSSNASFRRSEFDKDYVQERLAKEVGQNYEAVSFKYENVAVETLDSFGLSPIAIKVDVEGLEKEVLQGAHNTIQNYRPMILIEMNNLDEFLPLLEAMDYLFFSYDADSKSLGRLAEFPVCLNIICLHPQSPAYDALSRLMP